MGWIRIGSWFRVQGIGFRVGLWGSKWDRALLLGVLGYERVGLG